MVVGDGEIRSTPVLDHQGAAPRPRPCHNTCMPRRVYTGTNDFNAARQREKRPCRRGRGGEPPRRRRSNYKLRRTNMQWRAIVRENISLRQRIFSPMFFFSLFFFHYFYISSSFFLLSSHFFFIRRGREMCRGSVDSIIVELVKECGFADAHATVLPRRRCSDGADPD